MAYQQASEVDLDAHACNKTQTHGIAIESVTDEDALALIMRITAVIYPADKVVLRISWHDVPSILMGRGRIKF